MKHNIKTIVQCDFDGTITEDDESFLLLDAFARGNWRKVLEDYREGRISVADFNSRAFAMVEADRKTMVDFILRNPRIRPGFDRMAAHCRARGYRLVIVSNGLDFYIDEILGSAGMNSIEIFAARTSFDGGGLDVRYIGPDGAELQDGFKEAYTRAFLEQDYRVVYLGNGPSDMRPAALAQRVYAIDDLLRLCREHGIDCTPFRDFDDVIGSL